MFEYPFEKYKFYVNENKRQVIAISTYAGKIVRGVATCHGNDIFNIEIGKKIAAAKCNLKVAEKRFKRAFNKRDVARYQLYQAQDYYSRMFEYQLDANAALQEAKKNLAELESEF